MVPASKSTGSDAKFIMRRETPHIHSFAQVTRLIRKAFGHAADPRRGPSSVKYDRNCKKVRAAGRALPNFAGKVEIPMKY